MDRNFIINELFKLLFFWGSGYALGSLVYYNKLKVNYTRKIGHFNLLFIPAFCMTYFPYQQSELLGLIAFVISVVSLSLYIKPIRTRIPFIQRAFLAFDRPEDRPHTLLWLYTQMIACIVVMIPIGILLSIYGYSELMVLITPLAMVGDGLAEPIGIRFGKHHYKAYALFSKKKYQRTLEGSATVFIASVFVLLLFHGHFTKPELLVALVAVPTTLTVAEAISPHTWDQPFLLGLGGAALFLIKHFV